MGILALVTAAVLTAAGVGLLAVAYVEWTEPLRTAATVPSAFATPPPRSLRALRTWFADLRLFQQGKPIQARPTPPWERLLKWARRRPAVATLSAVAVCCILAELKVGWFLLFTASPLLVQAQLVRS